MIEPMLCGKWKGFKRWCYAQCKFDGVRCLKPKDDAYTRNLKLHKPHIQEMLDGLNRWGDVTLDGELMLPLPYTFQQTVSAVKKYDPVLSPLLKYHVYDFFGREGEIYNDRLCDMNIIVPDKAPITIVPTFKVECEEDVNRLHKRFTHCGYEGTIIRDPFGVYLPGSRKYMWKKKDWIHAEYEIIDVWECTDGYKGMAKFRMPRPNYKVGDKVTKDNSFGATAPGDLNKKRWYWEHRDEQIGKPLTVKFFCYTDDGVPRFPIAVEVRDYE